MFQTPLLDGKATHTRAAATTTPTPGALDASVIGGGTAGRWVKRAFDVAIALVCLVLLAPLMGLVALLVALDGGPVLVRDPRVGRGGRTFACLQFRTTIDDAEASFSDYLAYNSAADPQNSAREPIFDPRMTAIGRVLRGSDLDELPQLLNVLRGDMSLVGPAPIAASDVELYRAVAPFYFNLRPGLTGLWQISGHSERNAASRIQLDERYLREWSFVKDLAILADKAGIVLRRRGL